MVSVIENSYVKTCPQRMPAGLIAWIRKEVLPHDNIIIYKKGNRRGKCYICGSEINAKDCLETDGYTKFVQGMSSTCPACGTRCWDVLEGGAVWKADNVANVATVQRGKDGSLWIREWHVRRTDKPEVSADNLIEVARYCLAEVQGKWKAAKWVKEVHDSMYSWYGFRAGAYPLKEWSRDKKVVNIYDGLDYFKVPDDWTEIAAGTPLEYIDLQSINKKKAISGNPIRWILDFGRYPVLEKLYNAGYVTLVSELEGYGDSYHLINRQAKTIQTALHLPLWVLKQKKPGEWMIKDLQKLCPVYKLYQQKKITKEEIPVLLEYRVGVEHYQNAIGHASVKRIHEYIDHMNEKHSYASWRPVGDYNDYLNMCELLDMDLSNSRILFPKNLEKAHADCVNRLKAKENAVLSEKISQRAKKLERYSFDNGMYLIRPAASWAEMNTEGKVLHHCVVTYAERVAKGETAIFFIRKKGDENEPFYTLELRGTMIIQCRTKNNVSYDSNEAVKAFVDLWKSTVVKKYAKAA